MQLLTQLFSFTRQGIPDKRSSIGKRAMPKVTVLVVTCGMRRVLESEEEQSCLDEEYTRKRPNR